MGKEHGMNERDSNNNETVLIRHPTKSVSDRLPNGNSHFDPLLSTHADSNIGQSITNNRCCRFSAQGSLISGPNPS